MRVSRCRRHTTERSRDRAGRFAVVWHAGYQRGKNNGAWYRYEAGTDAPEIMLDNVGITNTLVWYEGKVWFADTKKNRFYSANARRINPQKISCFSSGDKSPDGSALAQNGWLITACWGSKCLLRQQINQGELLTLDTVPVPVTQPSCCTFGGPDMTDLYITSARKNLDAPHALEGALLHVQTSTVGVPQNLSNCKRVKAARTCIKKPATIEPVFLCTMPETNQSICFTSTRSSLGTSNTIFSSRPSMLITSTPPKVFSLLITSCTRISGAEAPAVTPMLLASFSQLS